MVTICDTGPLVAYLNRDDPHHAWSVDVMRLLPVPFLTCEAVLTEAAYFLREEGIDTEHLFTLLERGNLRIDLNLAVHWPRARTLMARYKQMDLADASLVVMTELHTRCQVLTLDRRDFSTYRRKDRQVIPFLAPP